MAVKRGGAGLRGAGLPRGSGFWAEARAGGRPGGARPGRISCKPPRKRRGRLLLFGALSRGEVLRGLSGVGVLVPILQMRNFSSEML